MKALSLTQPWASLVAIGVKQIETRSWATKYGGRIAIHASKGFPPWAREFAREGIAAKLLKEFGLDPFNLPLGAIVATAELVTCHSTNTERFLIPLEGTFEYAFGDYSANRFMWMLEEVRLIDKPIPCTGALSLWDVPEEIVIKLKEPVRVKEK